jgi:hypothetical protein
MFLKRIMHGRETWKKTLARDMLILSHRHSIADKERVEEMALIMSNMGLSIKSFSKVTKDPENVKNVFPRDEDDRRFYLRSMVRVAVAGGNADAESMKYILAISERIGMSREDVARQVDYYSE